MALEAWLRADVRHVEAFARLERVSRALDRLGKVRPVGAEPNVDLPLRPRVLAITNSQILANGGSLVPLKGYAARFGVTIETTTVGALPNGGPDRANIARYADAPTIVKGIQSQHFDHVLVTSRNSVREREGDEKVFAGLAKLHRIVAESAAELVLGATYLTRDESGRLDACLPKWCVLQTRLASTEIAGRRHPVPLIPVMALWEEGKRESGVDAWMADRVHGSVLAQPATGALTFAFHNGRDPVGSPYRGSAPNRLVTPSQARWSQKAAQRLLEAAPDPVRQN